MYRIGAYHFSVAIFVGIAALISIKSGNYLSALILAFLCSLNVFMGFENIKK